MKRCDATDLAPAGDTPLQDDGSTEERRMTKINVARLSIAALLALGSACASKSVDIGDDQPAEVLGQSLSDYAGQWEGYAEAYEWDDDTDRVRITLDANGNGVLEVGEAEPLPPPVRGEPYPPSVADDLNGMIGIPYVSGILSGFAYTVTEARVESTRIKFDVASGELMADWCGLYEPHLVTPAPGQGGEPFHACSPYAHLGYTSDGTTCWVGPDGTMEADCFDLNCIHTCSCTETECTSTNAEAYDVQLDAVLENEGEELEGTLVLPGSRVVVRMTRM
jgi:hypothetical protein